MSRMHIKQDLQFKLKSTSSRKFVISSPKLRNRLLELTPEQSLSFKLLISASSETLDMMRLWIWSRSWTKQLIQLIKLLFVTKSSPLSTRLSRSMKPSSLVIITTIFLLFFKQPSIQLMLSLLSALHQLQVWIFKSSGRKNNTPTQYVDYLHNFHMARRALSYWKEKKK